jgi:hypothetical protein
MYFYRYKKWQGWANLITPNERARTLIVGCSFVQNLQVDKDSNQYRVVGTSGSGNQAIAARVLHECSQERFARVIVIWSGINRLDVAWPFDVHDTFAKDASGYPAYAYYTPLRPVIWYHSGGFYLSGTSEECPAPVRTHFKQQYLGATPRYLADLSLGAIISTQGFLTQQQILYDMTWIYDIDRPYTDESIEPGCGQLDRSSPLNALVDWSKFITNQPIFEHCRECGQLEDGFHPLQCCIIPYLNHCFGLDLKPLDPPG